MECVLKTWAAPTMGGLSPRRRRRGPSARRWTEVRIVGGGRNPAATRHCLGAVRKNDACRLELDRCRSAPNKFTSGSTLPRMPLRVGAAVARNARQLPTRAASQLPTPTPAPRTVVGGRRPSPDFRALKTRWACPGPRSPGIACVDGTRLAAGLFSTTLGRFRS